MKKRQRAVLARCVLDSGGLSALTGRSARARGWIRWLAEEGGAVLVPTAILVETTTGDAGRDAEINRILNTLAGLGMVPLDELTARRAGRLRYRARTDDGVDAVVAAVAVGDGTPCALLTSDPADLRSLLANDPNVTVVAV